jgi:hypothetical protein
MGVKKKFLTRKKIQSPQDNYKKLKTSGDTGEATSVQPCHVTCNLSDNLFF